MSGSLTIERGSPVGGHGRTLPSREKPRGGETIPQPAPGLASVLRRVVTPTLKKIARGGARLLLRGTQRRAPRLHDFCSRWLYEYYYGHRYANEYRQKTFVYEPLISIIMPVYNPSLWCLQQAVNSVRKQKYARWEFCIADDASTAAYVRPYLERLQAEEPRVKVLFLEQNQHISRATNAAMRTATGDYFLFLDNDDTLFTPWVFTSFVDALQDDRADLLYADNVMLGEKGAVLSLVPKPEWEVDFLLSTCYVTHPLMVSGQLMERLGGFRPEYSGAQDIDLINRASLLSPKVKHIAKYLYGWRMTPNSVTTSTDAKPTIIPRSLRSYNDRLGVGQSVAVSTWPMFFRQKRIGAFKLDFPHLERVVDSLALVVVGAGDQAESAQVEQLRRMIPHSVSDVLVLEEDQFLPKMRWPRRNAPRLVRGEELADALAGVGSEHVLFMDSSIDMSYTSAIDELLGYLLLDPQIGAVAGKVLDHQYRIRCSSYVFLHDLRMFGQWYSDATYEGYWYKNRLAHNALAVPDRFFMTRSNLLAKYGLDYEQFGGYAVPDFCLRLGQHGLRTVYNPWAVCLSPEIAMPPTDGYAYQRFKERYCDLFGKDPFYPRCD